MYFDKFPKIYYKGTIVTNISRITKFKEYLKNNISFFEPYRVKDGETPEILAHDFYGDANRHWIILLMNDIVDPFYDWVLQDIHLSKYVTKKYGTGNETDPHHYLKDGLYVSSTTPGATLITNYEHEVYINEAKRAIKLVKQTYIEKIEAEFENRILE